MPRPVPRLTGKIVVLRPICPLKDAHDYYVMNLDPEMHTWTGNRVLASEEEARQELEGFVQRREITMWAIEDIVSGRMVGRFFVCVEDRQGRRVVGEGNRIAKPFWRKGHNREARRLVSEYVFDVLKADHIETECWDANTNSRCSILAHGFELIRQTEEPNKKHRKGMTRSTFQLTREQWLRRRA